MENLIFIIICYQNKESGINLTPLLITAILGFGTQIVIFIFNELAKRKNKIETLKNEVVGICQNLIETAAHVEMYSLLTTKAQRWTEIDPTNKNAELEFLDFIKRTNDVYLKYNLLKSDLVKYASELCLYDDRKSKIRELVLKIKTEEIIEFRDDFKDLKTVIAIQAKFAEIEKTSKNRILLSDVGEIIEELQALLNPVFFKISKIQAKI